MLHNTTPETAFGHNEHSGWNTWRNTRNIRGGNSFVNVLLSFNMATRRLSGSAMEIPK